MAKQKEVKTNAMRILESLKIPYTHHTYECEEFVDGLQIADKLSLPYEQVYRRWSPWAAARIILYSSSPLRRSWI